MTWIKLNDNAPRHPKVAGLSDRAFRAWVNALCYASEFLTDGVLPVAFLVTIPRKVQDELIAACLWVSDGSTVSIHDYLGHQTSKQTVAKKKADTAERVARHREARRNRVTPQAGNAVGNAPVTPPENREQIQRTDTENREQTMTGGPVIVGGAQYARLQEKFAFVGPVLKVPHKLHSELLAKSGGAHREEELQRWYLDLNDRLEETRTGTGDVFEWLRPRHQSFAKLRGWVEDAPKITPKVEPFSVAKALERDAARKAGAQ